MFSLIVEVPSDFKAEFYSTVRLYHIFFFFTTFSVSIRCQWTFKLFPHINYCEQCCNEQLDLLISSSKRILG